ncbi:DUF397 domain-containing protein [Actinoplanes sp. TFC3]
MTKWIKSSYCSDNACVEVAEDGNYIVVRDGKNRTGSTIRVSKDDWRGFLAGVVDSHRVR